MNETVLRALSIARSYAAEKLVAARKEKNFQSGERTIQSLLAENNLLLAEREVLEIELATVLMQNKSLQDKIDFANDSMGRK